jgi:hypothetical protein
MWREYIALTEMRDRFEDDVFASISRRDRLETSQRAIRMRLDCVLRSYNAGWPCKGQHDPRP